MAFEKSMLLDITYLWKIYLFLFLILGIGAISFKTRARLLFGVGDSSADLLVHTFSSAEQIHNPGMTYFWEIEECLA